MTAADQARATAADTRREEFLPFHRPWIGEEEIAEVVDTLRSGWLTHGPKTQRFEELFAEKVQVRHALAVSSCTAGLHLMLAGAGIGPGDEVITTPYTFTATAATILYTGATVVLADTLEDYPNIDPDAVEALITDRTRAIVPVHFAGAPCDLGRLAELATGCGAMVLEDAAHALPSTYGGVPIGGHSRAAAFSFYAGKNITTAEGGMVTTNDDDLADAIRIRRLHGISRDAWKRYTAEGSWYYEVQEEGFKYNMTDVGAAIGIHQLARLEEFHARRCALVALYNELMAEIPGIVTPAPQGASGSAWHLYVIRLDPAVLSCSRDAVIEGLKADNIGTSVHFIPIHLHPRYQRDLGCTVQDFPNATRLYEGAISLPLFPAMTEADVHSVARSLARIVAGARR